MKTTITIDGEKYPMLFGMGALIMFCKEKEIEIHEFDERFAKADPEKVTVQFMEDFAQLIICAIKNAMRKGEQHPKLDQYDIFEWMSSGSEEVEQVKKLFFEGKIISDGDLSGNPNPPVKKRGSKER